MQARFDERRLEIEPLGTTPVVASTNLLNHIAAVLKGESPNWGVFKGHFR